MDSVVEKRVRGASAYFTIRWSHLATGDKYRIISSVPSMGGIYELYYLDDHRQLVLIERSRAWYGGLRARLRKAIDVDLQQNPKLKQILEEYKLYYRYTMLESYDDMVDITYFFERLRDPKGRGHHHSGRYEMIYVKEISADKIITL